MDDLEIKLATGVIQKVLDECVKGLTGFSKKLFKAGINSDFLGLVAKKYVENAMDRHASVKILGMSKPVKLSSIYTRVKVLEKIPSRYTMTEDEIDEFMLGGINKFRSSLKTIPAIEVANDNPRLLLLGGPGSGKTTFLKHLFAETLKGRFISHTMPVFVSLSECYHSGNTLLNFVVNEFVNCGITSDSEAFVIGALTKGRMLLILDGLDEVPEDGRDKIIKEIIDVSENYPNVRCIASCRIAAYEYWFNGFVDAEIADFGRSEVQTFIENWFRNDKNFSSRCWQVLNDNKSIMEIARTPLLLALVCIAFEHTLNLSTNRAEIYRDAVDALLRRWDASRRVVRDTHWHLLTISRKEDLLAYIAVITFKRDEYILARPQIEQLVQFYLDRLTITDSDKIQPIEIVRSIEEQHGLLTEITKGSFSFSHLTLQEYFVASYICKAGDRIQTNLILEYFDNDKWREVIILVACMLSSLDKLLIVILYKMVMLGFEDRFLKLLLNNLKHSNTYKKGSGTEWIPDALHDGKYSPLREYNQTGNSTISQDVEWLLQRAREVSYVRDEDIGAMTNENANKYIVAPNQEFNEYIDKLDIEGKLTMRISDVDIHFDANRALDVLRSQRPDLQMKLVPTVSETIAAVGEYVKSSGENQRKGILFISTSRVNEFSDAFIKNLKNENLSLYNCVNRGYIDELYENRDMLLSSLEAFGSRKDLDHLMLRSITNVVTDLKNTINHAYEQQALRRKGVKAFIAAETLVEILKCPISVSSAVRVATIKTLEAGIRKMPQPPDDYHGPYGGALSLEVA